jgi:hypothetical protein
MNPQPVQEALEVDHLLEQDEDYAVQFLAAHYHAAVDRDADASRLFSF